MNHIANRLLIQANVISLVLLFAVTKSCKEKGRLALPLFFVSLYNCKEFFSVTFVSNRALIMFVLYKFQDH